MFEKQPPKLELTAVEEVSPARSGFLWLVRRKWRIHYPSGSDSSDFLYDIVDRRARDAVVILAHCETEGQRCVYLRSALRPPLCLRSEGISPVAETHGGNLWELPAGLIEESESQDMDGVRRAAARELKEELGFSVELEALRELGPSVFPAPGMIAERQFFFSVEVKPSEREAPGLDGSALEEGADIISLPLSEALACCRSGGLPDSKSELALRRFAELWAK